jgi:hypothetical protein
MIGVLPALEIELSAALNAAEILDVPVVPGQGDGTRPDEYVSIVAIDGEHRGAAHLCNVEFRIVGPVFSASTSTLQERLGIVYQWATSDESPLRSYSNNGLQIFGHSPANLSSDVKDNQRAEIIEFKVGAMMDS